MLTQEPVFGGVNTSSPGVDPEFTKRMLNCSLLLHLPQPTTQTYCAEEEVADVLNHKDTEKTDEEGSALRYD